MTESKEAGWGYGEEDVNLRVEPAGGMAQQQGVVCPHCEHLSSWAPGKCCDGGQQWRTLV